MQGRTTKNVNKNSKTCNKLNVYKIDFSYWIVFPKILKC